MERGGLFAQRFSRRLTERPGEAGPGGVERRIVAEVAVELRISPKFSDDGRPEGTCERALSIHVDAAEPPRGKDEEEAEQDLAVADELVRAFRD